MQMKGVAVNDDAGLEKEADVMGAKSLSAGTAQPKQLKSLTSSRVHQRVSIVMQLMDKPAVTDGKLSNIVNAVFKGAPSGGTTIGDGSAFAACAHEVGGGTQVGGRNHEGKIKDIEKGLTKLKSKHNNADSPVNLSAEDLVVVGALLVACSEALDGTYTG
jgi:hypothetical protein